MSKKSFAVSLGTNVSETVGQIAVFGAAGGPIGLIVMGVEMLLRKIFHGADPRQVPASQIEQAFQAASNNVLAVGRAGMLSLAEVQTASQFLIQKGSEYYQKMPALKKAGTKGAGNMKRVIQANIDAAAKLVAETRTASLDLTAAKKLYMSPFKTGWYRESLQASASLTDEILKAMPADSVGEKVAAFRGKALAFVKTPVGIGVTALSVGLLAWGIGRRFAHA